MMNIDRFRHTDLWLGLLGLFFVATLATKAAPMLPGKQVLPDEILCLAEIRKVSLHINALPREIINAGVEVSDLEKIMADRLTGVDIDISDEALLPRLILTCLVTTDPAVPDGMAVACFLDVHQDVEVLRLQKRMTLPVATMLQVNQTTRINSADVVGRQCAQVTQSFVQYVSAADLRT